MLRRQPTTGRATRHLTGLLIAECGIRIADLKRQEAGGRSRRQRKKMDVVVPASCSWPSASFPFNPHSAIRNPQSAQEVLTSFNQTLRDELLPQSFECLTTARGLASEAAHLISRFYMRDE